VEGPPTLAVEHAQVFLATIDAYHAGQAEDAALLCQQVLSGGSYSIFLIQRFAEPVQGFDRPLPADEPGRVAGPTRVSSRLVTPSAATSDMGVPWR
jgi:hypothetical protein